MKLDRLAVATVFALSAAACGGGPAKEVKSAQTNLSSEQQEARNEQEKLTREQAQEQAEAQQDKPLTAEERAELERKQTEQRAETSAEGQKNVAEAREDLGQAHASMQAERTKLAVEAKERLAKAEAKAKQASTMSAKVPAKKRARFNSDLATYKDKKIEVENRLDDLSRTPDQDFTKAKSQLDKSLDDLESAAESLHDAI